VTFHGFVVRAWHEDAGKVYPTKAGNFAQLLHIHVFWTKYQNLVDIRRQKSDNKIAQLVRLVMIRCEKGEGTNE
jgi:hypothetical protein